jgi:uncharacterized protein
LLLQPIGFPAEIYRAWEDGRFQLLVCQELLDEVRATLRKPRVAVQLERRQAGRVVNQLKFLAEMVHRLPLVRRSPDPTDDFLLAQAQAGKADFLVTGDKFGMLSLERHDRTRIVTARVFLKLLA